MKAFQLLFPLLVFLSLNSNRSCTSKPDGNAIACIESNSRHGKGITHFLCGAAAAGATFGIYKLVKWLKHSDKGSGKRVQFAVPGFYIVFHDAETIGEQGPAAADTVTLRPEEITIHQIIKVHPYVHKNGQAPTKLQAKREDNRPHASLEQKAKPGLGEASAVPV